MTSSAPNKTCSFCSGSAAEGGGKAIFTGECSHAFHFSCIGNYLSTGNRLCPVCAARWTHLPPLSPFPIQMQNPFFNPPPPPQFQSPFPSFFARAPATVSFCDEEPLPADNDSMSIDDSIALQKVSVRAVPERGAVAASESVDEFSVLVGLTAPSLSPRQQRAPIDIVTVLDVSGSMQGTKLSLLKRAVNFVIDNLGPSDRLSIVSFSGTASRLFPLRRTTPAGCNEAKRAVNSLEVLWTGTNIAEGLRAGARVLEERRYENPVSAIMFLSDGCDTFNLRATSRGEQLPQSISPRREAGESTSTIPVHSFGFGADHDPITMHAIAEASGGTFSFIESYETVQDAFAGCIGGLLSVVAQELRLKVRSASHGVEIRSIPSGRYRSEITKQGTEGIIHVGDVYADEEKEFLVNVSVPASSDGNNKTSLLDITCSYKDALSKQAVVIEGDLVETKRPAAPSPQDLAINLEVDRQKSRVRAAEGMKQAQQMAEMGNLFGATSLLQQKRSELMCTASAQAGDGMAMWLEGEMKETERRFGSPSMYQKSGRAFALAGMSSHASQRATTRGGIVAGGGQQCLMGGGAGLASGAPQAAFGAATSMAFGAAPSMAFGGYATKQMSEMVHKSQQQQQGKAGEGST